MERDTQQDVDQLWRRYRQERDEAARTQLIQHYLRHVQKVARQLHQRYPRSVQLDDLVSAGVLGLLKAIARFDPGQGACFETFCFQHVRGAMVDSLRNLDDLSRHRRLRQQRLEQADQALRQSLGRAPSELELCDRLAWPKAKLREALLESPLRSGPVSLSTLVKPGASSRELTAGEVIADPRTPDPARAALHAAAREAICRGLNTEQRLIVVLKYYEDLTMREIGQVLGVCESRVSQLHKQMMALLRVRLRDVPGAGRAA